MSALALSRTPDLNLLVYNNISLIWKALTSTTNSFLQNGTDTNPWLLTHQISGVVDGSWNQAQFPIITTDNYEVKLLFTRQLDNSGKGFVAVDDVKFIDGTCNGKECKSADLVIILIRGATISSMSSNVNEMFNPYTVIFTMIFKKYF